MKIYQLENEKRYDYDIDIEDVKNEVDLVKRISKNKDKFIINYNLGNSIGIYVENIPKKICKYKELTIVIYLDTNEISYFSGMCSNI